MSTRLAQSDVNTCAGQMSARSSSNGLSLVRIRSYCAIKGGETKGSHTLD